MQPSAQKTKPTPVHLIYKGNKFTIKPPVPEKFEYRETIEFTTDKNVRLELGPKTYRPNNFALEKGKSETVQVIAKKPRRGMLRCYPEADGNGGTFKDRYSAEPIGINPFPGDGGKG
jgi:hypothetical protein